MLAVSQNPANALFVYGFCAMWVGIIVIMARRDK